MSSPMMNRMLGFFASAIVTSFLRLISHRLRRFVACWVCSVAPEFRVGADQRVRPPQGQPHWAVPAKDILAALSLRDLRSSSCPVNGMKLVFFAGPSPSLHYAQD